MFQLSKRKNETGKQQKAVDKFVYLVGIKEKKKAKYSTTPVIHYSFYLVMSVI